MVWVASMTAPAITVAALALACFPIRELVGFMSVATSTEAQLGCRQLNRGVQPFEPFGKTFTQALHVSTSASLATSVS